MIPTLTRGEVIRASRELRAEGSKLPAHGWCVRFADGRELCRDRNGYYWSCDAEQARRNAWSRATLPRLKDDLERLIKEQEG